MGGPAGVGKASMALQNLVEIETLIFKVCVSELDECINLPWRFDDQRRWDVRLGLFDVTIAADMAVAQGCSIRHGRPNISLW